MEVTYAIRLANKEDLQPLAKVYAEAYNSADIGENWSEEAALKLITYLYKDQPDLFFIAESQNTIAGAIVATVRPWMDGNHLIEGELFLHPTFQRHGIGVALIEKLFSTAKEQYQVVAWDTFTHVIYKHPLSWYKKLGFEEIKEWKMITGNVETVLQNIQTLKK